MHACLEYFSTTSIILNTYLKNFKEEKVWCMTAKIPKFGFICILVCNKSWKKRKSAVWKATRWDVTDTVDQSGGSTCTRSQTLILRKDKEFIWLLLYTWSLYVAAYVVNVVKLAKYKRYCLTDTSAIKHNA